MAFNGADERLRTPDPLITNQLLYQLSYIGIYKNPDKDVEITQLSCHRIDNIYNKYLFGQPAILTLIKFLLQLFYNVEFYRRFRIRFVYKVTTDQVAV